MLGEKMIGIALRLAQALSLLLLPVLWAQGRLVKRRTPRLPEATTEAGESGTGSVTNLLVFGDSMAAGVGVKDNADGLAGHLARALSEQRGGQISWRVVARHGATAQYATDHLSGRTTDPLTQWTPDIVVVTVGINDLLRFTAIGKWKHSLRILATDLRGKTGKSTRILFCGMPPVGLFPSLPQPLRATMSIRSKLMDWTMAKTVEALGCSHLPLSLSKSQLNSGDFFSADGFHPSSHGYRDAAKELTRALTHMV